MRVVSPAWGLLAVRSASALTSPRASQTLLDKVWSSHVVAMRDEKTAILYIDRHLVHEVTSPQAFEGLALAKRPVRRPDCTLCTVDHNVPTTSRADFHGGKVSVESFLEDVASRTQVMALEENVERFNLPYFGMKDARQGIVHVVGPEQGFTLPGTTIVCGDSHTATHGAFGSLAFGIGTSEVEHVLATQTILQQKPGSMLVKVDGTLAPGVTSKDLVLYVIGQIGTAGGTGKAIEFAGTAIEALSMEARMSMSNMAIEAGARAGFVAPDETTFDYLRGRPMVPPEDSDEWRAALEYWRTLHSDEGASFDVLVQIDAKDVPPMVTWGTSPQHVVPISAKTPKMKDDLKRAFQYMGLEPEQDLEKTPIDYVFIGSCTNGRIEDLRAAAKVVASAGPDARVPENVQAIVVPGSGLVKLQAESEGLDAIFTNAGFQWREPGCSMCLAMNPDKLLPQQRCASTSNRNFEGRQGNGGRTHLVSPQTAAACALEGALADVRRYLPALLLEGENEEEQNADAYAAAVEPVPALASLISSTLSSSSSGAIYARPEKVVNREPLASSSKEDDEDKECDPSVADCVVEESEFASKQLTVVENALAAPLDIANVDTDMIIPKEYLKTVKRTGLGFAAFAELRYENPDGVARGEPPQLKDGFVLNKEPWADRKAKILIAGENFGCGSSREHAPWAIKDAGILVVVAPSFADIFYNNCFKNGMLPVTLARAEIDQLLDAAENQRPFTVDLAAQTVSVEENDLAFSFEVDAFRKRCLLEGLDDIALTLEYADDIDAFEDGRSKSFPWLDGAATSAAPQITVPDAAQVLGVTLDYKQPKVAAAQVAR